MLQALINLFMLCELLGAWPEAVGYVVIALLTTKDGGFRPIGNLPTFVRVWFRARADEIKRWEALNTRSYLFAGVARGG